MHEDIQMCQKVLHAHMYSHQRSAIRLSRIRLQTIIQLKRLHAEPFQKNALTFQMKVNARSKGAITNIRSYESRNNAIFKLGFNHSFTNLIFNSLLFLAP